MSIQLLMLNFSALYGQQSTQSYQSLGFWLHVQTWMINAARTVFCMVFPY